VGLKEAFLKDGRKPLQRRARKECVHAPAPAPWNSLGTQELSSHTWAAWTKPACLAARVCIFTAENILFLSYVPFESGHEL